MKTIDRLLLKARGRELEAIKARLYFCQISARSAINGNIEPWIEGRPEERS